MKKCFNPCIYYQEVYSGSDYSKMKILCNIKDRDIRNIPDDEVEKCDRYMDFKGVKRMLNSDKKLI